MQLEKSKVGQYFIYIGLILLVVFFVSDQDNHPAYAYLFAGFGLLLVGGYIYWRGLQPVCPNPERFRTLRKLRERRAKRTEERTQKKNR